MSKATSFRNRKVEARVTALKSTALRREKVSPTNIDIAGDLWRDTNQNQRLLCRMGSACRGGEFAMCFWITVCYLLAAIIQNRQRYNNWKGNLWIN